VVFSDHGEEFGDHGGQFHGRSAYEELNRVPLLFVGPGIEAQSRPGAAWLVDLAPTLLDLAGAGVPGGLHGRSLVGALRGAALPERTLLIEVPEEEGPLRLRAAVRGRWKLIANYRSGTLELYDLAADPLERGNRLDLLDRTPAELRAAVGLGAPAR
jgi:arylsulfatase A-like enzyme